MIRKEMPQIIDQPTTDDKVQNRQRKRREETENTDSHLMDQTHSRTHPRTKRLEQQYLL